VAAAWRRRGSGGGDDEEDDERGGGNEAATTAHAVVIFSQPLRGEKVLRTMSVRSRDNRPDFDATKTVGEASRRSLWEE
jgi:hypothetical protein